MFLIRRSGVAHTSWDIQQLLRNATWHPHKGNTSLLIHKKCVADFPGTCALFSRKKFIFHSLLLCALLARICNASALISNVSGPSFLSLSPSSYPWRQRALMEGVVFLFLFPHVFMKLWLFLCILCEFHIVHPNSTHFPVLSYPPSTCVSPHLPPKIKI